MGGEQNAVIRLVVDYYRLPDAGVLDVVFEPRLTQDYKIETGGTASPTALLFGPSAFGTSRSAAAIVHTIVHAYEDARLRREKHSQAVRDFLAIRVQIVSKDMAEELFMDLTSGFGRDAVEALRLFQRLTPQERFRLRTEISEVQAKVAERASQRDPSNLSPAERRLIADWQAVVL